MIESIPSDQAVPLMSLVTPTEGGISSRVLAKTAGGSLTLFAFDEGQGMREHRSPHEALAVVNAGIVLFTVGPAKVRATPGTIVHMPANVPHDLEAIQAARLLLVTLRGKATQSHTRLDARRYSLRRDSLSSPRAELLILSLT